MNTGTSWFRGPTNIVLFLFQSQLSVWLSDQNLQDLNCSSVIVSQYSFLHTHPSLIFQCPFLYYKKTSYSRKWEGRGAMEQEWSRMQKKRLLFDPFLLWSCQKEVFPRCPSSIHWPSSIALRSICLHHKVGTHQDCANTRSLAQTIPIICYFKITEVYLQVVNITAGLTLSCIKMVDTCRGRNMIDYVFISYAAG